MKKMLWSGIALMLCLLLFAGCGIKEPAKKVISPLPQTLDPANLTDCTVAISFEKGNAYIDDNGKMQMKVKVHVYDFYAAADIEALKAGDRIMRLGEEIEITDLERLASGLVRINGGVEKGGFELFSEGDEVFYESGMSDVRAHYEIGEVTLPVSDAFLYRDESDLENVKEYSAADFLADKEGLRYNFTPHNTILVIRNGEAATLQKRYTP